MPTYRCRVIAFVEDDFHDVATFPFELDGDHDPKPAFIFLPAVDLQAITGAPVDDPVGVLEDDDVREALAKRIGLVAAGYVTREGGTASVDAARDAVREGLAKWLEGNAATR